MNAYPKILVLTGLMSCLAMQGGELRKQLSKPNEGKHGPVLRVDSVPSLGLGEELADLESGIVPSLAQVDSAHLAADLQADVHVHEAPVAGILISEPFGANSELNTFAQSLLSRASIQQRQKLTATLSSQGLRRNRGINRNEDGLSPQAVAWMDMAREDSLQRQANHEEQMAQTERIAERNSKNNRCALATSTVMGLASLVWAITATVINK